MKLNTTILIILCVFISKNVEAQLCGGGILTLEFYSKKSAKLDSIRYELFLVSKDLAIDSVIRKDKEREKYRYKQYLSFGVLLNSAEVDLLKKEPVNENEIKYSNKLIKLSKLETTGKVKEAIEFRTSELVTHPFMLKITSNNKTLYYMGNFFGGCSRRIALLWNNYPRFIRI